MKKIISISTIAILICFTFIYTASSQQGKEKGNQKERKTEAKQNGNGNGNKNEEKGSQGKSENDGSMQKGKQRNEGEGKNNMNKKDDDYDKKEKGKDKMDKGNNKDDDNRKNGKMGGKDKAYYDDIFGYRWDKEKFNDRKKYKNNEKVNICHKISNGDGVSIMVSENAVKAHLNHGDVIGQCPKFARTYSDVFYNNRQDYYNSLQRTQEQTYYSQSILEYALTRLAYGRSELSTLQAANAPAAVIQDRQNAVNELQQNASLLETLVGVAVTVVANSLN